ncbi:MAG: zinc-ribbon domain-containing protein [Hyphomicrobiaceae bacterium]
MIIRCPNCGSTYDISKQPQAAGRKVKCMRCAHVWKADPIDVAPATPAPPKIPSEPVLSSAPPPSPVVSEPAPPRPPPTIRTAEVSASNGAASYQNGATAESAAPFGRPNADVNGRAHVNGLAPDVDLDDEDNYATAAAPPPAPRSYADPAQEPPQRPVRGHHSDAEYFGEQSAPPRPRRRPEPLWREPPPESYRDDVYGDYDQGDYGADGFAARQSPGFDREPRAMRGRRAATIVGWVAYLAAMGALAAYAYVGRDQIVAWLPGAAPYYAELGLPVNRYGLVIKDVKATWGKAVDGQAELTVAVAVENVTDQAVKVPTAVIAFRDANGDELFYRAMVDALPGTLQAGKSSKFSATLKVPVEGPRAIQVRFASSR